MFKYLFLLLSLNLLATEYSFDGYYKAYFLDFRIPQIGNTTEPIFIKSTYSNSATQTVRFNTKANWNNSFSSELSYALFVNYQYLSAQNLLTSKTYQYRLLDLNTQIFSKDFAYKKNISLSQNLDRLNIKYSAKDFDLIVGRQSISLGVAKFVSPNDVLQAFSFTSLDTENRIGVDAVRLSLYYGTMNKFDLAYVFAKDFKSSSLFVNTEFYKFDTNISVLAIIYQNNLMFGTSFTRNIGDASAYVEFSYTLNKLFEASSRNYDYLRLSVGFDYNLTADLYYNFEYHYNGAGLTIPRLYATLYDTTVYQDGAVYLLAKHYIANTFTYQFNALTTLTSQVMLNLNDWSVVFPFIVSRSFSDNIVGDIGLVLSLGKQAIFNNSNIVMQSEFGAYPSYLYIDFKWYF